MKIDQFRIPGRTGASFVKPTKVRLMRGRNESTRAVEMANHHCFAFNCKNSTQKQKNVEKYLELANVRFCPFPQGIANKYFAAEMSERERRMQWWITAYRLDSWNVMRHTGILCWICSVHFEGGPGLTKLNPVNSTFAFPQHLQGKATSKAARERKHHRRRRTRCLPPQQDKKLNWS